MSIVDALSTAHLASSEVSRLRYMYVPLSSQWVPRFTQVHYQMICGSNEKEAD